MCDRSMKAAALLQRHPQSLLANRAVGMSFWSFGLHPVLIDTCSSSWPECRLAVHKCVGIFVEQV